MAGTLNQHMKLFLQKADTMWMTLTTTLLLVLSPACFAGNQKYWWMNNPSVFSSGGQQQHQQQQQPINNNLGSQNNYNAPSQSIDQGNSILLYFKMDNKSVGSFLIIGT